MKCEDGILNHQNADAGLPRWCPRICNAFSIPLWCAASSLAYQFISMPNQPIILHATRKCQREGPKYLEALGYNTKIENLENVALDDHAPFHDNIGDPGER